MYTELMAARVAVARLSALHAYHWAMDPRRTYSRWLQLWNGDLSVADSLIHPACVIHQARTGGPPSEAKRGTEAVLELVEMGRAPFEHIHFSIEVPPIVERDMLAARWRCEGAYMGGIPGATAAPGTTVSFGGIDIMRLDDGRIAEYWVSSDGLALMAQLGVA